ncbi:MAG: aldo/keto reductase [Acidobacteria bacterium]|nr:aldo/keto reductase [Acidobacteriota bacterium]
MGTMLSRRDFSKLIAGTSLAAGTASAASGIPTRPLGKIGFQASILGLGAQRIGDRPMEQSVVDRLIHEMLDNGLNFIDGARGYGPAEERLGRALKGKRDKVFLVSKTRSATREAALKDIQESLKVLQTDYLDCVHIHNVSREDRYPDLEAALSEKGVLGGLVEAKKQGMTKHIGCTSHLYAARVLPAFATGQIELFMCTLNFVERHIYNFEERALPEARRRGIGIVAMKVLGGPHQGTQGRLVSPEDYQATLRYVWGVPGTAVMALGMRNVEEFRQALAAARAYKPLSKIEMAGLMERGKKLASEWGEVRGRAV